MSLDRFKRPKLGDKIRLKGTLKVKLEEDKKLEKAISKVERLKTKKAK